MSGTLDEFETKMHEAFYDYDNEFPHNKLVEQFLCLSKKEQNKFLNKYKKKETFVQLEAQLSNDLYNGVVEEFVENHIKSLKSFYSNLLIISFLVDMFGIYNNPNYNEKLSNDFLNKFLRLPKDVQKRFLAELGFEGESILKLELKNENQFSKLPESVKCKFIDCHKKEFQQNPNEIAKKFDLMLLKFLLKLKTEVIKYNEKYPKVEINENALMDFGGIALIFGIILLISGLVSTFLFPPAAWGLCLGLGTVFFTAGGFSIYKATKKNESLNKLYKNENVKDLHEKLNGIEEEDMNEKLNKSEKLNTDMSEIPLLANGNVSQNPR